MLSKNGLPSQLVKRTDMALETHDHTLNASAPNYLDVALATRIGGSLARRKSLPSSYRPGALEDELNELSIVAQERVAKESGLTPPGKPRARILDRAQWVSANVASVDRLVGPALAAADARRKRHAPAAFERLSRQGSAAQLGSVLAWMSSRVLGQYDVLVGEEATFDEDVISYVGPNIVALEQRHGFDPSQFRLWLALHETTHRAQFTGPTWVRPYFLGLINDVVSVLASESSALVAGLTRALKEMASGQNPMREVGAAGLIASEEQLEVMRRLSALMSVLEGHGEVVMDEAARDLVPDAQHFHSVLRQRRQHPSAPSRILNQVLGLDAKLRQYEEGETFIRALREAKGPAFVTSLFDGPENLPSMEELKEPSLYLARTTPTRK
ncbi:unannotated protein [freshwater metagenome]|uniref:Unannotated protein n=1 Tax=freshwater metagenome TaxID=449393 RepID=A0A6J6ZP48_9ZZZZ|nr:hypothetical protein [Actinomycetota bacterium]